jgi:hypothetical protein
VLLSACGGDSPPARSGPQAPAERGDRRPPLPAGWRRVVNAQAGFSLGLPPGWSARGTRGTTLIRSADRVLAVAVSADRSEDGMSAPLPAYARRTIETLPGYVRLRHGRVAPVRRLRYSAVRVSATGTFRRTGVRQAISLIALRRPRQVTYTLAFFRNRGAPAGVYAAAIREMVATFRAQPPQY